MRCDQNSRSSWVDSSHAYNRTRRWLCGLKKPRAMNFPSCARSTTSCPGAGSPSSRSSAVAKTQGCRLKNGNALRGFTNTVGTSVVVGFMMIAG